MKHLTVSPFTGSLVIVKHARILKPVSRRDPAALVLSPAARIIARAGLVDRTPLWPSEVLMIAALFGRPGTAVSVHEMAELLWPQPHGGPDYWRSSLDITAFRCRARLAPFGLSIARPVTNHLCSAEMTADVARAA